MKNDDTMLLSIDEAARRLGVGNSTVRARLRDKTIGSVKIGDRRLVPIQSLRDYVAKLMAAETTAQVGA